MKKLVTIAVLFIITTSAVLAVSPTSTATPTDEAAPAENAEQLRDLVKQKARELIDKAKLGHKKAYVGQISKVNGMLIDLDTRTGSKQALIATGASMLVTGKGNIDISKVKNNDYAIAMGYVGENEILDTRRLVIFTKTKEITREVAFGRIVDISNEEEKILTIKNDSKETTYTIEVTNDTTISKKIENKMEKVAFSQVKMEDKIVVIGQISSTDKKIITAEIIHIIPSTVSPTPTTIPPEP